MRSCSRRSPNIISTNIHLYGNIMPQPRPVVGKTSASQRYYRPRQHAGRFVPLLSCTTVARLDPSSSGTRSTSEHLKRGKRGSETSIHWQKFYDGSDGRLAVAGQTKRDQATELGKEMETMMVRVRVFNEQGDSCIKLEVNADVSRCTFVGRSANQASQLGKFLIFPHL
jgi:hypothetical protein